MSTEPTILITGACGQIGTELLTALKKNYSSERVIATDRYDLPDSDSVYFSLNVLDKSRLQTLVRELGVTQIYHLAAVLSANGEKDPVASWNLNMQSLINVLEVARNENLEKVFWPSSIAVFGNNLPKHIGTQHTVTEPVTAYGISKAAGEHWCQYYCDHYGLDVRSLRYPGLVSSTAKPGGGTTDYAVEIFHKAIATNHYTCFLKENSRLPMLYMPDAIRGTIELMEAPAENIKIRTAYNMGGMNFTPGELASAIRHKLPGFTISYEPDWRQQIADSWPSDLDDSAARNDWGWHDNYNIQSMASDMLEHLTKSD